MTTQQQVGALQRIGLGVLEVIQVAAPDGAPSGVLYAAMSAHGASLSQYQSFMDTLTRKKMLTLDDSHCYHITVAGEDFMRKLQSKFPV